MVLKKMEMEEEYDNGGGKVNEMEEEDEDRMAQNTITNLKPRDRNIIREGKVNRRWISQSPPNPAATRYYCILLYREGNAVKAND
ncbi:hypothetical protein Tco_1009062 [Tanacetum coccineum]